MMGCLVGAGWAVAQRRVGGAGWVGRPGGCGRGARRRVGVHRAAGVRGGAGGGRPGGRDGRQARIRRALPADYSDSRARLLTLLPARLVPRRIPHRPPRHPAQRRISVPGL